VGNNPGFSSTLLIDEVVEENDGVQRGTHIANDAHLK
jgi:hypothetical protein